MTNTPEYPLTGGVKPTAPGFPSAMNPEIIKLQEKVTELNQIIHDQASELHTLQAIMDEKDRQIARYFELLAALVGVRTKTST